VNGQDKQQRIAEANTGRVVAVCTSERKDTRKRNVEQAELRPEWGIVGDAHADDWHRQVSLLAWESIEKMRALGLKVNAGSFAENITTEGICVIDLPVGTHLQLGESLVEVTQIGKECHDRCAVYYQAGDCVMPREGIFVRVHQGGMVKIGDKIAVVVPPSP
jgi:MOSC domain-containing protein YiiM